VIELEGDNSLVIVGNVRRQLYSMDSKKLQEIINRWFLGILVSGNYGD